jgi:hypothetical protein
MILELTNLMQKSHRRLIDLQREGKKKKQQRIQQS